jgi:hypothetical protein
MRLLYVFLLTMVAFLLGTVLFQSRSASAQAIPGVRVDRIIWDHRTDGKSATVPALGQIVGFQCVKTNEGVPECFVASKSN